MWIAVDLLFCLWLAASIWWQWRRGAIGCLHALSGVLLAYAAAAGAGLLCDLLLRQAHPNLWLRFAADAVLGMAAGVAMVWLWRRAAAARRERWTRRLGNGVLAGALRGSLVATWLAGNLLGWLIIVNLVAAAWPAAGAAARGRSLFSALLLGSGDSARQQELDGQQRALRGLRGGLAHGVDEVLDATGTRGAMEMMETLQWVANLPPGQRERLLDEVPELQRLAGEPELRAVADDPRLMALVDEAGDGSFKAVYALGGEPAVQALMASPAMRDALRAIDLPAARRRIAGPPAEVVGGWRVAVLATTLDLDACLADDARWERAPEGPFVSWPVGTRYAVMRVRLPSSGEPYRLRLSTAAELSCWIDGALVRPRTTRRVREIPLPPAKPGPAVVVLLDFGGADGARVCAARVLSAAGRTGD